MQKSAQAGGIGGRRGFAECHIASLWAIQASCEEAAWGPPKENPEVREGESRLSNRKSPGRRGDGRNQI